MSVVIQGAIIGTPLKNSLIVDGEEASPVVNIARIISYSECDHLWSYLGKIVLIVRNFFNAAARDSYFVCKTGKDYAEKLKNITTYMKLLSVVSVFFNTVNIQTAYQKLLKDAFLKDWEGIALSTISVTIIASDILDSITTFANAALAITCNRTISLFSAMGLPLGFVMSGLGTVSRTVQIAKNSILHRKIHHEIVSRRELDVASLLELENRQKRVRKTMAVDALGITGNLFSLAALTLFAGGASGSLPFALLGCAYNVRLLSVAYQDHNIIK